MLNRRRKLEGKVCLVTGAGSGLGASLATELVRHGAKVVLAGRREQKLEDTAARIGRAESTLVVRTDVTRHGQLRALIKRTLEHFGALHLLFNNAGVGYGGTIDDVMPAELLHQLKTNCIAPIWLLKLALPELRRHDDSLVVTTLSLSGLVGMPGQSGYCSSKFALRGFLEALERDGAKRSPKHLLVYPGAMDTEMNTAEMRRRAKEAGVSIASMDPDVVARKVIANVLAGKTGRLIVAPAPDRFLPAIENVAPSVIDAQTRKLAPQIQAFMVMGNAWARARNTPEPIEDADESRE